MALVNNFLEVCNILRHSSERPVVLFLFFFPQDEKKQISTVSNSHWNK